MKYKNLRTGAVIETLGVISGGDWQEILPASTPKDSEQKTAAPEKASVPKKESAAKKTSGGKKKPVVKKNG